MQQLEINALLYQASAGNNDAYNKLFPIIYTELRHIAHRIRFQFFGIETLNTTAIVHEAYLKIASSDCSWESKAHFYGVAGKAMRQILLNAARKKKTGKRGEGMAHLDFSEMEESIDLSDKCSDELIALEKILHSLAIKDERQVKIVECRFFANMTVEETAEALDISSATVKRSWQATKVWIYTQLQQAKTA